MTDSKRLSGVLSPVVTPFNADLSPDADRLIKQCQWLLSQNVGLAVFGTNSEANSLSVDEKIDLLYLDFWTPDPEGSFLGTGRAQAYKAAYQAARDQMNEHSLILIDDTDHVHPWKHTYIIPEARKDGFVVMYTGRQTLLQR